LGFIYSVSISWNINGVSHNFIHNPYFRSPLLNRLFSILESITVGFSQIFYECIHMQHHKGNADRPDEHGEAELALFVTTFVILGILNWRYICFVLPFYYFGHCLSYLNGYYRHYGRNPDEPIAWGVSSYDKLYNWIWFYNGYHAEHHFRPKVHWTQMRAFREQIVDQQHAAGVRVIKPPHALGFLDPGLPRRKQSGARPIESEAAS
jgi:fatty acid desaturase